MFWDVRQISRPYARYNVIELITESAARDVRL